MAWTPAPISACSAIPENTVFRIEDRRAGFKAAMRIHRPNYQTRNAIQTELDWMRALNEAGIGTPQALPALHGAARARASRRARVM